MAPPSSLVSSSALSPLLRCRYLLCPTVCLILSRRCFACLCISTILGGTIGPLGSASGRAPAHVWFPVVTVFGLLELRPTTYGPEKKLISVCTGQPMVHRMFTANLPAAVTLTEIDLKISRAVLESCNVTPPLRLQGIILRRCALEPCTYLQGTSLHRLRGCSQLLCASPDSLDPRDRRRRGVHSLARRSSGASLGCYSVLPTGAGSRVPLSSTAYPRRATTGSFSGGRVAIGPHPHPHPPCPTLTRPASSHAYRSEPRATDAAPPTVQDGGRYCGIAAISPLCPHHCFSLPAVDHHCATRRDWTRIWL